MLTAAQIADIKLKYDTHGFCHLRQLLPADFLARLRSAFDAASARYQAEAASTAQRYFDIPSARPGRGIHRPGRPPGPAASTGRADGAGHPAA